MSDRATALIQLAEQGLEYLSIPDGFHLVHAIVKRSSLAIARPLRRARKELQHAEEWLERRQERAGGAPVAREAKAYVEARQSEVQQWEAAHHAYRHHLATLSLMLHPFSITDSTPQTSAQVESRLHAAVDALEV